MPLHEKYKDQMSFFACDFSPNAVELLIKQDICKLAFVKNLVSEPIDEIEDGQLDFITMIFMLSAIHPKEHVSVMRKLASKTKVGGHILFRDYGAYDLAMMRFINKKKGIIDLDKMIF